MSKKLTVLILSFVTVLIYSNTFSGSFHFDDLSFISGNTLIRSWENLGSLWRYWPGRFIGMLTFAANYRIHGLDVFGYHLVNVGLHLGAALLVIWMARLSLALSGKEEARGHNLLPLLAGMFFALHPIQTQAVNYIFQRVTLLVTVFYLAAVVFYLKSANSGKRFYSLALLSGLVAAFTKETAATLPLVILLSEILLVRRKPLPWKLILPFFLVPGVVLALLYSAKPVTFTDIARMQSGGIQASSSYFFTSLRVSLTYIRLLFVPFGQNLDYDYTLSHNFFEPAVVVGASVVIAILALGSKLSIKAPLVAFGIFWFFLTLLPDSSFIPLLDVINEYRLYLPMAGFSLFAAAGVCRLFGTKHVRLVIVFAVAVAVIYSGLTYQRNRVWKDEVTLWGDVINKSPNKLRGYNERGLALVEAGKYEEALKDFTRMIELAPKMAMGWNNRGLAYFRQGKAGDAAADFNRAIQLDPKYYDAYINRGLLYKKAGQDALAELDFQAAARICPDCR